MSQANHIKIMKKLFKNTVGISCCFLVFIKLTAHDTHDTYEKLGDVDNSSGFEGFFSGSVQYSRDTDFVVLLEEQPECIDFEVSKLPDLQIKNREIKNIFFAIPGYIKLASFFVYKQYVFPAYYMLVKQAKKLQKKFVCEGDINSAC